MNAIKKTYQDFLKGIKKKLKGLFRGRMDGGKMNLRRGLPPFVLRSLLDEGISAFSIPDHLGGRGAKPTEILSLLEAISYESLPLSLMFGINGALFLEPVCKYGDPEAIKPIMDRFLSTGVMGGLMITEPDHGTDALSMQTLMQEEGENLKIQGEKHWAGLTGWADYWLMTGREVRENGNLKRDIDFVVMDMDDPAQRIEVEEYYENLGLQMIPYGKNKVNGRVPKRNRLKPTSSGIKLMMDLLHRSRMRFPGMALGFLKRIYQEAVDHIRSRKVGGKPLAFYDQVQHRITEIQSRVTLASGMILHASENSSIEKDLVGMGLEANVHKTLLSDFMQDSAQSLLQLFGAKGYRQDSYAGSAITDSRPFQIFEGSNDVIYQQISDAFTTGMERLGVDNLFSYLKSHPLTLRAAKLWNKLLNFRLKSSLSQRLKVNLGKVLGHLVSMEWTLDLGDRGYDNKLIVQAMEYIGEKVSGLLGAFHKKSQSQFKDDTTGNPSWMSFSREWF